MVLNPDDTIVALASPPGSGGRAVVRLSGDRALQIAETFFRAQEQIDPNARRLYEGEIRFGGLNSPLPAMLLAWPSPRSFTGQFVVELHTISSPPLVERLLAELLAVGARAAEPGEFTLRAFLAGKLDLSRAEAVLGVVDASDREELRAALAQLAGGVARPMEALRDDLLSLLADVEAGLDFVEEDISFVATEELLKRLAKGMAELTLLQKQLDERGLAGRPFRVALVGPPNVGKSRLFNALTGSAALVSDVPGTTRDFLVARLDFEGQRIELIDTAGQRQSDNEIESQAQKLGDDMVRRADLLLQCVEAGDPAPVARLVANAIVVATKCDLSRTVNGQSQVITTSAVTGEGLGELKGAIVERFKIRRASGLAPSLSRCRHHVIASLEHLRRAHSAVLFNDPGEVLSLELRGALEQIGEMVGAVYTDDLLDRIFSRFCIGK